MNAHAYFIRELLQEPRLKDATRPGLLDMIRTINDGLPFAVALGNERDVDVPWVAVERATDDELRLYLAHNKLMALIHEFCQEDLDERVQRGEVEVVDVHPDGTPALYRKTAK